MPPTAPAAAMASAAGPFFELGALPWVISPRAMFATAAARPPDCLLCRPEARRALAFSKGDLAGFWRAAAVKPASPRRGCLDPAAPGRFANGRVWIDGFVRVDREVPGFWDLP